MVVPMKEKKIGKPELGESLKLLALIREDAVAAVNQGTSPRKQALRDRVTAGAYALKSAIEDVERFATL